MYPNLIQVFWAHEAFEGSQDLSGRNYQAHWPACRQADT